MGIVTVGIDLAKNVFALHGVHQSGKAVFIKPKVVRGQLLEMVARLPPCLIGMEACSRAHHWARAFSRFGHTVKLMAPKFVAPYRMSGKRGKNDAADAAANQLSRSSGPCSLPSGALPWSLSAAKKLLGSASFSETSLFPGTIATWLLKSPVAPQSI